jgi:hypothetical protein
MSLADYKIFVERWEREMIPLCLVLLKEFHSFQRKRAILYNVMMDSEETKELLDFFFALCKKHNVKAYREYDKPEHFAAFEADMRARFGPPADPPEFTKDLPKNSWYEVQNCEFNMHKLGEWTFSVEDAKASNKRATKMPGDHHEWATSYTFDRSLLDLEVPSPLGGGLGWGQEAGGESPHPNPLPEGEGTLLESLPEEGINQNPLAPLGERVRVRGEEMYRLYVAVRCEAKEGIEGTAMTLGVYDYENNKGITSKTLSVAEIRGSEYHWIDLGMLPLRPKLNLWFAPPRRPGEVDAVYIDRIVVVREK